MEWIDSPEGQARFLWIFGPAGSGKSAIAQTIAEICFKLNKLAASFFFSRNAAARNNESMLITTLVYQLANSFPEMREDRRVEDRV
jgi:adenylate kinase family enzyme